MIQNLTDIDRFIIEAMRVRRSVQVYDDLYCSQIAIKVLRSKAEDVFSIFQRALHDEILLSLSRLFDSTGYKTKNGMEPYLSQYYIVQANQSVLTKHCQDLRARTSQLLQDIDINNYRDLKVAHNDKTTLNDTNNQLKHNISSEKVKELLDVSMQLMVSIKCELSESPSVSLPVNLGEKYEGRALDFLRLLQ